MPTVFKTKISKRKQKGGSNKEKYFDLELNPIKLHHDYEISQTNTTNAYTIDKYFTETQDAVPNTQYDQQPKLIQKIKPFYYKVFKNCSKGTREFDNMNVSVVTIPQGSRFYRGFKRDLHCSKVQQRYDRTPTWLASFEIAARYAHSSFISYSATEDIVLFDITNPNNLQLLINKIINDEDEDLTNDEESRQEWINRVLFATGYNTTLEEQKTAFYSVFGENTNNPFPFTNWMDFYRKNNDGTKNEVFKKCESKASGIKNDLNRISVTSNDAFVAQLIDRYFGDVVHGYFCDKQQSTYHGEFHREICTFGDSVFKIEVEENICDPEEGASSFEQFELQNFRIEMDLHVTNEKCLAFMEGGKGNKKVKKGGGLAKTQNYTQNNNQQFISFSPLKPGTTNNSPKFGENSVRVVPLTPYEQVKEQVYAKKEKTKELTLQRQLELRTREEQSNIHYAAGYNDQDDIIFTCKSLTTKSKLKEGGKKHKKRVPLSKHSKPPKSKK